MKMVNRVSFTTFFFWGLLGALAVGENKTQFRVLRIPVSKVSAVRSELSDEVKGSQSQTMDQVAKDGNEVLAEFEQVNPWRTEPVDLQKVAGKIQAGGEELELGVKLKIEGSGKPEVSYNAEVTLPTGGKGARFFQVIGGAAIQQPAAWHERCCWSNGKECLMLWEFPVREGEDSDEAGQKIPAVQVEMRWFQASEADVSKLAASKPETREKALQWLAGRAKLWREAGYGFKPGNPCVWQMSQGKHDPEKGNSISDEGFTIQTQCREEAGKLKMNWTTSIQKKGDEKSTTISAEMTPGVWEFLPVQGNPEANVVVCRVTKS